MCPVLCRQAVALTISVYEISDRGLLMNGLYSVFHLGPYNLKDFL